MEPASQDNSIKALKDIRKLFNELRSSLTNIQKNELRNAERCLKNIGTHLKNFKKYLKKLERYQYGSDHLFNEEEDYITEPQTSNNSINGKKLFNEVRSNLLRKEINEIRKKLRNKEAVYNSKKKKKSKKTV